jgi:hypothetical protein
VAHGNQLTVYIDDFAVAAGTTEYESIGFSAGLSLDMNKAVKEGWGSVTPISWKQLKGDPGANQLSLSLEFDSTAGFSKDMYDALIAAIATPFQKVVRLEVTLDANHSLVIDFAGYSPEAGSAFADTDGIATVEFVLNAQYEATLGGWLEIVATNQVATLV